MNLGVFVLGLEQDELDKCGVGERSLYHFIGLGFWIFLGLTTIAGGINLYYINDHFLSIAFGAILFPVLLGFLFRILLLSVKRPPRYFLQKWYCRWLPDLGSLVRLVIVTILTLLIAMPLSGILQYHRVERVAEEKRQELRRITMEASSQSFASSISADLEQNEHTHYPVAVYSDLLTTGLTKGVIFIVFLALLAPVLMLLLLKFRPVFRYQEQINAKIEVEARSAFEQAQIAAKAQLDKFGAASEFPMFNEYEDYPINSIKRVLPGTTVKNDQELLSLLWLPKK